MARCRYGSHRKQSPWSQVVDPGSCPLPRHKGLWQPHTRGCYCIITTPRPKLEYKYFAITSSRKDSRFDVLQYAAGVRLFGSAFFLFWYHAYFSLARVVNTLFDNKPEASDRFIAPKVVLLHNPVFHQRPLSESRLGTLTNKSHQTTKPKSSGLSSLLTTMCSPPKKKKKKKKKKGTYTATTLP